MTVTAGTPARYNPHHGAPCPSWCRSDHSGSSPVCIGSGSTGMPGPDNLWSRALIDRTGPKVCVTGSFDGDPGRSAHVEVPLYAAEDLANVVELLAGADANLVHQLAASIRRAAADLAGEQPRQMTQDSDRDSITQAAAQITEAGQ